MTETHTITEAKGNAILDSKTAEELENLDESSLLKPHDILDQQVTIYGAWSLESEFKDSALVKLSLDRADSPVVFVVVRGNAGRQALELHNRNRTPAVRVLRKISVGDDRCLYTWKIIRT
jgi:hypothetical protein